MNDKAIRAAAKEIERHKMEPWTDTKAVEIARDAIAAYEAAMWRPIEKAKRERDPILAETKDGEVLVCERLESFSGSSSWVTRDGVRVAHLRRFRAIPRPLPAAPESEG